MARSTGPGRSELLARVGIEHPIVQAPMGGGPTTPELVAAVSNAGGLGSLAGAYLTPDQIAEAIRRVRALTGKPFNVNLFSGRHEAGRQVDPAPMLALLAEIHAAYGLPPPILPVLPPDPFAAQNRGRPGGSSARLQLHIRDPIYRGARSSTQARHSDARHGDHRRRGPHARGRGSRCRRRAGLRGRCPPWDLRRRLRGRDDPDA